MVEDVALLQVLAFVVLDHVVEFVPYRGDASCHRTPGSSLGYCEGEYLGVMGERYLPGLLERLEQIFSRRSPG